MYQYNVAISFTDETKITFILSGHKFPITVDFYNTSLYLNSLRNINRYVQLEERN